MLRIHKLLLTCILREEGVHYLKKILLTGFEPFGGETINPALETIKKLPAKIEGVSIICRAIPTVFHKSGQVLTKIIEEVKPDVIILIGQAGGRAAISLERVALNIDDARIPDNEGNQPIDEPILRNGPSAYFTNLPIKRLVYAMNEAGIPAQISNTAGTFVCNHLMYYLLAYIDQQQLPILGGFMHVPYLPTQTVKFPNQPSMSIDNLLLAIKVMIQTINLDEKDSKLVGGSEI